MTRVKFLLCSAILLAAPGVTQAAVETIADKPFASGPVFTLNPEDFGPAQRNIAADRELAQAFQNPRDIMVGEIVIGIDIQSSTGGLNIEIVEVEDTNANPIVHGATIATIEVFDALDTMPNTDQRLLINLTGADQFLLPKRNTGTQGYAMLFTNDDATTNIGALRHSNDGTDHYPLGLYYAENGSTPNPARDLGISIRAPEPASLMLGALGLAGLGLRRRR